MTELRHTPAPWGIDHVSLKIWQHSANGYAIGTLKSLYNEEETKANIKLIEATPEMLKVLIEVGKCLQNADDRTYEREMIQNIIDKATK